MTGTLSKTESMVREILRSISYDPLSGALTWRDRQWIRPCVNSRWRGKKVGCEDAGYVKFSLTHELGSCTLYGHQAAWVIMTGEWPVEIDHEDRDGLNNRWLNLRPATRAQNSTNTCGWKVKPSGLPKGVFLDKRRGRFFSKIGRPPQQQWLGYFENPDDAKAAYDRAATERHGEFARS